MDQAHARALLASERARLQRLLQATTSEPQAAELGDDVDDADRRNAEETGMAVDQLMRDRWAALMRAEASSAGATSTRTPSICICGYCPPASSADTAAFTP